ncbi:MAG TPA: zinc-binding dehydrogenase [Chloroflexota bacterium]|nr:zinc-binding dehydrogenase [Chloroflexota bacterium]
MTPAANVSLASRRIVFPTIRHAAWEDLAAPKPELLGPRQVLLRTAATLVSAGTEIAIYSGSHIGYSIPGSTYPRMPHHPGYSLAGTVEAVGAEVRELAPGDRIAASASHASWVSVDLDRAPWARLPDGVTPEQGALARLAGIAMQGVRLASVRLGDGVAVFGQGLIGQFARQLAALDGAATTIGVDLIDARLQTARHHGATHTINPSEEDALAGIMRLTDGRGVPVAIEATGSPTVIDTALKSAADLGRVILLGSPRGRLEIDPYSDIHRKGVSVIGAHARTADLPDSPTLRWNTVEQLRLCVELIRQGRLCTDGLVTHHVPADQALGVFDALMNHPQDHLGVVIDWR